MRSFRLPPDRVNAPIALKFTKPCSAWQRRRDRGVRRYSHEQPAGRAGRRIELVHAPRPIAGAILIGIDLGPNLSVTGSLATILWLIALRREGETISAWDFLKLGMIVMPPEIVGALLALIFQPRG